ncbi:complex I NDUFA9 subunit family protein [Laribacter hongkongensis]|uniref:Complex I NDUFA9 subunit family protein n=2 Tax=Laribacter hongkongensis TaxID=168471 RepID=A0A248LJN5_9NEIS|nr:complex I NDUFA9 subunit family protein [Laribacter hongkongensis]ASJ24576.1 putative NADH-ubiquinone oxidoreductase [Laribacter hongkongensis]MCG9025191.1 complex I NDUFA9 subunit family protein [Laribacter hongkongensis]MCG9042146.1 complex I NDUFA9 subunit family protein [Laribacter hongkongensis]MCG9069102.1 complex I NDUFA9 subunit family protein [Laribacter hongkongensis]MCG9089809.1 complex I NDUFA9 subunit family protein [Laribacter hongkongensis]
MNAIQRVALLGGGGFIGSWLTERLTETGKETVILTRRPDHAASARIFPTAEIVGVDACDTDALSQALAGCDAVVNLVGILHGNRAQFEKAHVALTISALAACRQAGIERYLHVSALGAAADSPSLYQQSKAAAEAHVRASALKWTIFRPSVVFGPQDRFLNLFARLLASLPCLPLAGAGCRFQPVWVGDVARALGSALELDTTVGQTLELAGPDILTLRELVEYVGELTGNERPVISLPDSLAMLQAGLMELLPGEPLMSRDNVRSLASDNVSQAGFPSGLLGFAPHSLFSLAPAWLASDSRQSRLDGYRSRTPANGPDAAV